jgi:hypothetical protein
MLGRRPSRPGALDPGAGLWASHRRGEALEAAHMAQAELGSFGGGARELAEIRGWLVAHAGTARH